MSNKICFICHPYHRGGVTTWMVDFPIYLAAQGIEVWFITVMPKNDFYSSGGKPKILDLIQQNSKASDYNLIYKKVGTEFEFGTTYYKSNVYVDLVLNNVPNDIPIIPSDDKSCWNACAILSNRNPFIGVLHSDDHIYYRWANHFQNEIFSFVSVSKTVDENLKQHINYKRYNNYIIPCSIVFKESDKIKQNIENKLVIAWLGRISERQKRISDLPKIARLLKDNLEFDFLIKVIGDGDYKHELIKNIKTMDLVDHIQLCGWLNQEKVYDELFGSHILLITSNFEGMPVSAMEGLYAGNVVVSSLVSGIIDIFDSDKTGSVVRVFEIGNVEKAVKLIIDIVQNYSIESNPKSARKLAHELFSMEQGENKYRKMLFDINNRFKSNYNEIKKSFLRIAFSNLLSKFRFFRVKYLIK